MEKINPRILLEAMSADHFKNEIVNELLSRIPEVLQEHIAESNEIQYYSPEEFGRITKRHVVTIRKDIKDGNIAAVRSGRRLLIPAKEIDKYLKPL